MRFPIDPPPPIGVIDDLYEIRQTEAVRPVRAVTTGEVRTQTEQRHRPPLPVEERRESQEDTRHSGDRRKADRRQVNQYVFVDTRSGRDRRQLRRRPDDPPPPSIEEEA